MAGSAATMFWMPLSWRSTATVATTVAPAGMPSSARMAGPSPAAASKRARSMPLRSVTTLRSG